MILTVMTVETVQTIIRYKAFNKRMQTILCIYNYGTDVKVIISSQTIKNTTLVIPILP